MKNLLDQVDEATRQRILSEIKNLSIGYRFGFRKNGRVVNEVVFKIGGDYVKTLRYGVDGKFLTDIREVIYNSNGSFIVETHQIGTKPYHSLLETTVVSTTKEKKHA